MKIIVFLAFSILFFAACSTNDADTPTAAFRKYTDAASKKDAAAMKEAASRASQKLVDEAIKYQTVKTSAPETRNEKIEGERATLEYKNSATGTWDTVYCVRENGSWKLALDESMRKTLNANKE